MAGAWFVPRRRAAKTRPGSFGVDEPGLDHWHELTGFAHLLSQSLQLKVRRDHVDENENETHEAPDLARAQRRWSPLAAIYACYVFFCSCVEVTNLLPIWR